MNTDVFQALSDPRRLAIVELLADGERCVCDVSGQLGISNALASHHIKKLRDAGLVSTRRSGTWLHCRLADGALESLAQSIGDLARRGATVSRACCSCTAKEGNHHD